MTVRSSMAALITRTRLLIADRTGTVFTDAEIQQALDQRRTEQRHVALIPNPSFAPGGGVTFNDFYAGTQYWEDDVLLQDVGYNTVAPTTAEPFVGHWYFATAPNGNGVRATGKAYDLYGSAADLLEAWAATLMLEFDVTLDSDRYNRSQKQAQLRGLAADYRRQALVAQTRLGSSESMPDLAGAPAVTYPTYSDDYGW